MSRSVTVVLAAAVMFLCLAGGVKALECIDPIDTEQGQIMGKADQEVAACYWKGIPFAEPPVGDLRWRAPSPPAEREYVLEAFEFSPRCISGGAGSGVSADKLPEASEDCLYLNVWRPQKSGVFPVMVWIHGGSLSVGTAAEPIYWGERLSAWQDVVVVSINYRLNYFGFMAHPGLAEEDEHNSAGNYGLLDQVAALQWVKNNIEGFGGDPENVTIFGESAGGWSVCNLLASPLAEGLFEKAILESGGCDVVLSMETGFKHGELFADDLGCADAEDPVSCMRAIDPTEMDILLAAGAKERKKAKKKNKEDKSLMDMVGDFKWVPHIDGWAMPDVPIELIRSGDFNQVPFMVGSNRDEIKLLAIVPGIRLAPRWLVNKGYKGVVGEESLDKVKDLYPYRDYRRPADAAMDAFGHMALGCKCWEAAEAVSEYGPVYYYRFDYDQHLAPHMVGAAHGVEIPFIFGNLDKPPARWLLTKRQTKKATELSDMMMEYWSNFARTGDPNAEDLPEWPTYDKEGRQRMYLDLPIKVAPTTNVEQCEFWRERDISLTGE